MRIFGVELRKNFSFDIDVPVAESLSRAKNQFSASIFPDGRLSGNRIVMGNSVFGRPFAFPCPSTIDAHVSGDTTTTSVSGTVGLSNSRIASMVFVYIVFTYWIYSYGSAAVWWIETGRDFETEELVIIAIQCAFILGIPLAFSRLAMRSIRVGPPHLLAELKGILQGTQSRRPVP